MRGIVFILTSVVLGNVAGILLQRHEWGLVLLTAVAFISFLAWMLVGMRRDVRKREQATEDVARRGVT